MISEILASKNTDKNKDVKRAHCYGKAYDQLFKSFDRDAPLQIVEIGVEYGDSVVAWKEFFPNARVTGIDIEDKVEHREEGITYIIADVNDLIPDREWDIVIDDGSHRINDVLHVVKNFKLKPGGMMVIEDCQAPGHWYEEIRKVTKYTMEGIDLRKVHGQHDDYLIVLRRYDYNI